MAAKSPLMVCCARLVDRHTLDLVESCRLVTGSVDTAAGDTVIVASSAALGVTNLTLAMLYVQIVVVRLGAGRQAARARERESGRVVSAGIM